jgi:2-polyprenyl-6-methoxyphenol hydroxylase-like FAD-dependent oxidoreductase
MLLRHAAALPGVTLHNRTQLTGFTQDDDGVTARCSTWTPAPRARVRARYLVGCDGGSSTVRKQMGASWKARP